MKFTLNWLKEFVACDRPAQALAELLTMAGLEVEALTPLHETGKNSPDWLFEIAVTPNRGDCLGIGGIAREVAALTGGALTSPPGSAHGKDRAISKRVSIAVADPALCARYSARIIDQVRVAPAPEWLQFRLEACGIRSINNVVDITNYVMLETGQPLHAFDLDRLPASAIVARPAGTIRKFTTLDGVERELAPEDLLICAGDVPVALAGVMGGIDTEVREDTRSLLLESANFDPITVRRTAKRLALHSEASHRFERGVDPEGTVAALNRAVYLLVELGGGAPVRALFDRYPRRPKPKAIRLREERIERLLGVGMDGKRAEKILRSLGLESTRRAKSKTIHVMPSTSRPDLTRETDLIEELARLHSYQNIPTTLPLLRLPGGKRDNILGWERRARSFLAGEGLAEVVNLPFTTERSNRNFGGLWAAPSAPVAVLNPLAKESAEMRLSLIPGLIDNLVYNLAQRADSLHVFHLGKVYRLSADNRSEERQCLAGLLFGPRPRRGLGAKAEAPHGFLECKGLVEGLLDLFRLGEAAVWVAEPVAILHPGRCAALRVGGKPAGYLGQIHPDLGAELGLPPFTVFELDFEGLLEYAPPRITVRPLPRFPSVERDLAIVVARDFAAQQIVSWIKNLGESLIEDIEVFDQYLGAPIPEGKKSLAYKICYRAQDRTLTDAEVNVLHQNLAAKIGAQFGAQLRM